MKPSSSKPIRLMNAVEFEACVRDYSRFSHMVRIIDHFTEDRKDRRITRPMIMRTLRKGTATGNPKWDAEHQNWVGKMFYIGSGMKVTAVCAIKDGVLIVTVVTAYGRPSK